MKMVAGKIVLFVFLIIALCYNIPLLHSQNSDPKINTEFSLQEEHDVAGDLKLIEYGRTNSGINYSNKSLNLFLLADIKNDIVNYVLQVKLAKGFFLLKNSSLSQGNPEIFTETRRQLRPARRLSIR